MAADTDNLPEAPSVAVVTRTRDREQFLRRAARSIAGQRFGNLTWVVVNDGGSPEPVNEVIESYRGTGRPAIVIHVDTSRGMEAASNRGIAAVASDLIAIHDDDDTWEPAFLSEVVGLLESKPDLVGAVSHTTIIEEIVRGREIATRRERPFNYYGSQIYLADVLRRNVYPPISLVFRRLAYDAIGPFDEAFPALGDWEFNIRLLAAGDVGVVPKRLANYHWRKRRDENDPFANSVIAKRRQHEEVDARFRNAMLRKYIVEDPHKLGLLLSLHRFSPATPLLEAGPRRLLGEIVRRLFSAHP